MDWSLTGNSREAYEAFVKTHMKKAYFTALGLVGNHDDALELSQEAFARAYQHIDTLNAQGKLFPWFYQILRNLCFSHLRKRRHRQAGSLYNDEGHALDVPAEDRFDPEVVTETNETKSRLWKAIGLLEEKHREVIILRHFQHMSYDQMARVLFCSKGTVTSRLYYARKRLKEILELEKGGPL
jgi:RNA polymerase sigma-70 factor (ECF subfamily)